MLKDILTKIGLEDKEVKIYEAALESGPETVQKIARHAGITRTSAYIHINSLMQQGLMSKSTRDKHTYFSAEPPENLFRLVETRKKEAQRYSFELKKIMPQLRMLYETGAERPHVRVFEGREGLKTMIDDLLKSKIQSLEEFTALDEIHAIIPPQPNDHRIKIKNKLKKVPRKIIYTSSKGPFLEVKEGTKERRFLDKNKFPFTGGINVYGNKVSMTSRKKTITGVIIENKEIADTVRALFNLAWESFKKHKN
ncbi:MAG: hypothetical protein HYT93_04545 [Parcubacteria group bacterium]|nr:hypothetical protein [Parcubacteria group bacterium]